MLDVTVLFGLCDAAVCPYGIHYKKLESFGGFATLVDKVKAAMCISRVPTARTHYSVVAILEAQ